MTITETQSPERIRAIDALRGVAVTLWILSILTLPLLPSLGPSWATSIAISQLSHTPWFGLSAYDLVLPAFYMAMGAAVVFSHNKHTELRTPASRRVFRVLLRAIALFVIGILCNAVVNNSFSELRLAGVLQRISICYVAAATATTMLSPRGLMVVVVIILGNYWALLLLGEARPEGGLLSMNGNYAAYVDRHYLPGRAYFGDLDPEGILTTIPAIAVALLGSVVGQCIATRKLTMTNKLIRLAIPGTIGVVGGILLRDRIPINGYLWTPTFVLAAVGLVTLLVAGFMVITEVKGHSLLLESFGAAGQNSLILVIVTTLFRSDLWRRFRLGSIAAANPSAKILLVAIQICSIAALAWILYRKRISITV